LDLGHRRQHELSSGQIKPDLIVEDRRRPAINP
jgi:hypothetical protein